MFNAGDIVRSGDSRDQAERYFRVAKAWVRTTSGPVAKLQRLDGNYVYRLHKLLRKGDA